MDELGAVLNAWRRIRADGGSAVLATVVHVEGSAYRRPGARMLICEDGSCTGAISGGCLESDIARKAAWWTADGRPALRVYDTSSEEAAWEFGLGCNGVITVMLERLDRPGADEALTFIHARRAARESSVVATVIRADASADVRLGDRLLWHAGAARGGAVMWSPLAREAAEAAVCAHEERRSRLVHLENADVFVEFVPARQQLVIFGAGQDAIPVVTMAAEQGWNITVADGRPAYAKAARFRGADAVVRIPSGSDISEIAFDADAAVLMMTHNYPQDGKLLPQILERRPRYLGMLGPRRRAQSLFAEIGEDLEKWDVHAPAGLDLGGDSPAGIALSIISEIQSVLAGRAGIALRWRSGPIHTAPVEYGRPELRHDNELVPLTHCGVNV
jgi:xanthine/CO dehydrogenase XdhC/CoxF family maturation factor